MTDISYADPPFACPPDAAVTVLTLPLPPSVNALYANRKRGGRFKTKEYRAWIDQAGWYYMLALRDPQLRRTLHPVSGPYNIHIRVPQSMRGDVDNRIKPIGDFLVSIGLTDDDKHCQRATVERDPKLTIFAVVEVRAVSAAPTKEGEVQ